MLCDHHLLLHVALFGLGKVLPLPSDMLLPAGPSLHLGRLSLLLLWW
jgi:hypothetical protein